MKIKRSGRVLVVTLLVLTFYSGLVIWHNKPSNTMTASESAELLKALSLHNPKLIKFATQVNKRHIPGAFYSLGLAIHPSWPIRLGRASYADPLAEYFQSRRLGISKDEKMELIRYRSLEDLLIILKDAEETTPGIISRIDFRSHRPLQEHPLDLSLQLIFAVFLAIVGLVIVRSYLK